MSARLPIAVGVLCLAMPIAAVADEMGLPIPLYCSGGEPFWGLTIGRSPTAFCLRTATACCAAAATARVSAYRGR
jgi:hypothetical protein